MGRMQGSPPPADKLVRHGDASYYQFPRTRWSFANMRALFPTANSRRGSGPPSKLPALPRSDLDALTFVPLGKIQPMRWDEALQGSYADAIIVLHRGKIVYERYWGATTRYTPQMSFR